MVANSAHRARDGEAVHRNVERLAADARHQIGHSVVVHRVGNNQVHVMLPKLRAVETVLLIFNINGVHHRNSVLRNRGDAVVEPVARRGHRIEILRLRCQSPQKCNKDYILFHDNEIICYCSVIRHKPIVWTSPCRQTKTTQPPYCHRCKVRCIPLQ